MALPVPNLDDRRFQELVNESKRLVQQKCPEWTDHNVHDPGVTLIELFAWMTDQVIYRLNRVPDKVYVKFLELLGVRMFPPTAARAPVTFWLAASQPEVVRIPSGTQVATVRTETGGLNQDGDVVLHVPGTHTASAQELQQRAGWLRARVVEAQPDQPRYSASPTITRISAFTCGGTVDAVNAETVTGEVLGL